MTGDKIGKCPFCGCDVICERIKDPFNNSAVPTYQWSARHPFFENPEKDNTCIGRNVNFQWFSTEDELINAFTTRKGRKTNEQASRF